MSVDGRRGKGLRALIVTGFHKSGHDVAAAALAEEGRARGHEVHIVNIYPADDPVARDVLFKIFRDFALVRNPHLPDVLRAPELFSALAADLHDSVDLRGIDVAFGTHPYSTHVLAEAALAQDAKSLIADVHTDWTPFPVCPHHRIDRYFGAFPAAGSSRWVRRRQVAIGIPVRGTFRPSPRAHSRRTIAVFGGTNGWYGCSDALDSLEAAGIFGPYQVEIFTSSQNATKLIGRWATATFHTEVTDVSYVLQRARLVLTKPSGLTVAESLACHTPVVLLPSVVPWEANARRWLVDLAACKALPRTEAEGAAFLRTELEGTKPFTNPEADALGAKCAAAAEIAWRTVEKPEPPLPPPDTLAPYFDTLAYSNDSGLPRTRAVLRALLKDWRAEDG